MRAVTFQKTTCTLHLGFSDVIDPGRPASVQVRVGVYASFLNGHDLNVARGILPVAEGRILVTDAAGIVEEVGDGVTEFVAGDRVISTFFHSSDCRSHGQAAAHLRHHGWPQETTN